MKQKDMNCLKCLKFGCQSKGLCCKCYSAQYLEKNRERMAYNQRARHRKKWGIPIDTPRLKSIAGTGHINKDGYRQIRRNHPNTQKNGYILEHVYMMSNYIGRPLEKGETIHHKNGIRHDNRIENLELWNNSQPKGQRIEDKIKWAKEFLEQYGYKVNGESEFEYSSENLRSNVGT